MTRIRTVWLAAALATVATVSACSSSGGGSGGDSTSAPASTPVGSSSSGGSGIGDAQGIYDAGLKTSATFPQPSDNVTPGNRKIGVIAAGLATIGASATAQYVQEAIKAIGWSAPPTYDGKFQATVESGLIQQAVNGGVDALVLIAVTPSTVASAVNQALSKKLPIVCILCGPNPSEGVNGTIINVEPSPEKTGALQAAYAIVKSGGNAKALIYHDDEYAFTKLQIDAAVAALKACSGCSVIEKQMKSGDQLKPGLPILSSVLTQNPKGSIDYLIAPYDSAAQPFVQLTHQLGRDEIQVVGYSATPNYASLIGAGNPPGAAADITIPLPYMGWSAIDLLARSLASQDLWSGADQMPVGLLTKDNFNDYPSDSQYLSPSGDFRTMYKGLWAKS